MSIPSQLYILQDSEIASSDLVDKWVQSLDCQGGSGPSGLVARVYAAWSVVAQSQPRTPRSVRLLAIEIVRLPFLPACSPHLPAYRLVCQNI